MRSRLWRWSLELLFLHKAADETGRSTEPVRGLLPFVGLQMVNLGSWRPHGDIWGRPVPSRAGNQLSKCPLVGAFKELAGHLGYAAAWTSLCLHTPTSTRVLLQMVLLQQCCKCFFEFQLSSLAPIAFEESI